MFQCNECGSKVAQDENFCGNCGAQTPPASAELKTVSATFEQMEKEQVESHVEPTEQKAAETIPQPVEVPEETPLEEPQPPSQSATGQLVLDETPSSPEPSPVEDVQVLNTSAAA